MINILRRLTAVLLFIPFAIGELALYLFDLFVLSILKYILTGNFSPRSNDINFDRTARWCRTIAGDKKS